MVNEQSGVRELGAVLYLKSFAPIPIERFVSCFRREWPGTPYEVEGEEPTVTRLKIGLSHIAVELRRTLVPDSLTKSVLETTLHWPTAKTRYIDPPRSGRCGGQY